MKATLAQKTYVYPIDHLTLQFSNTFKGNRINNRGITPALRVDGIQFYPITGTRFQAFDEEYRRSFVRRQVVPRLLRGQLQNLHEEALGQTAVESFHALDLKGVGRLVHYGAVLQMRRPPWNKWWKWFVWSKWLANITKYYYYIWLLRHYTTVVLLFQEILTKFVNNNIGICSASKLLLHGDNMKYTYMQLNCTLKRIKKDMRISSHSSLVKYIDIAQNYTIAVFSGGSWL